MRRAAIITLCGLIVSLTPASASAQESGFGLGLVLGDPTGLSGKGWLSDRTAIDFAVGFAFYGGDHLILQADFLWHFPLVDWSKASMLLHVGVGPKLAFFLDDHHHHDHHHDHDDEVHVGARAPVGLTFPFKRVPLDVFVELAVGLWLIDDVDFDLDAAAGVRYWF